MEFYVWCCVAPSPSVWMMATTKLTESISVGAAQPRSVDQICQKQTTPRKILAVAAFGVFAGFINRIRATAGNMQAPGFTNGTYFPTRLSGSSSNLSLRDLSDSCIRADIVGRKISVQIGEPGGTVRALRRVSVIGMLKGAIRFGTIARVGPSTTSVIATLSPSRALPRERPKA
ncbi:hypothetical protein BC826DRAFT_972494 [Russula brevipes]|nr:hypothetical protein BC826DRAFT_972494 [Russula brevipes]